MNKRRARGGVLAACTLAGAGILVALLAGQPAVANELDPTPAPTQSTTYATVPDEFSLSISPTRLMFGPGEAGEDQEILVVNRGAAPLHVEVKKRSFVGAPDGSLGLQDDAPYSAVEWLTIEPSSFDLEPGATRRVLATVLVPDAPELGDHQVALVFLVPAREDGANIIVNRGIAIPVYITVPGPIDDSVTVSEFGAPAFSAGGPVSLTATVHNVGTVHRDFRGDTALAIDGTDSAFPDFTVVRGSERDLTSVWDPPFFCVCQLNVSIVNADGISTSNTMQVVVFPVALTLSILGALVVLLLVIAVVRRMRRRRRIQLQCGIASRLASGGMGDV